MARGQVLLQPESGWRRYDDIFSSLYYVGSWTYSANASYYQGGRTLSNKTGDYVKFKFTGSNIRILGALGHTGTTSINSNQIDVKIDDNPIESFSAVSDTSPTTLYQVIMYEKLNLPQGVHTITIENKQDLNVVLDAVDIDVEGELLRHDYFETNYSEPMRKYGVAWFGFDEVSGNVYDKLGSNYIGTVTGATRVQGWNGEGYAMNFNGTSNRITMNSNNVIPLLESTIKFKINTTQKIDNAAIFHQGYNTAAHGIRFYMINTGQLGVMILAGATANQSYLVSKSIIADGEWHEIHFTYDGTLNKNGMKLFVDEELEVIGGKLILPVQSSSETMIFGWGNTASPRWFNGQLDDLQIYNKALIPSDFTQKRLAIKSESNKNLVLSPTSTRVKEIPNTEESTLLNQGGVIHEIDSAIDRQPIDLTRISTEYEIVSNNKAPLNNGKMFTIPIDNNFKTAFVEDNY